MDIRIKRVYEVQSPDDGTRVLVDRIWPRGLTKEKVRADLWLKSAAPSAGLRKWFDHDRSKWKQFKNRYFAELDDNPTIVDQLLGYASGGRLTLLFSARDVDCNQAVALRYYLISRSPSKPA